MRCFLELALRVLSCPLPTRFDRCVDSKCSSEALTAISIFKSIQQQVRYSQIPKRTQHTYTHSDSPKEGREVSALSSIGDTTRFVEIFVFTVWLIVITTLVIVAFSLFFPRGMLRRYTPKTLGVATAFGFGGREQLSSLSCGLSNVRHCHLAAGGRRRFPPLLDTLVRDGFPLRSDPPDMSVGEEEMCGYRYDVCEAEHSLVRLSYNPNGGRVYMVRVPAMLRRTQPTAANDDANGIAQDTKTSPPAANKGELPELIRLALAGDSGAAGTSASPTATAANAAEAKAEALLPSAHEALANNTLHIISDVESKAVFRLSPHHMASMLSTMDEGVAASCYRYGRAKGMGGSKGDAARHALAARMREQMGFAAADMPSSPVPAASAFRSSLTPATDSYSSQQQLRARRSPPYLSAGRDPFAPNHFDEDKDTMALMRGEEMPTNAEMQEALFSSPGGAKKKDASSSSSARIDPLPGPRELQWYISEGRSTASASTSTGTTVTLISTLTTRQYELSTTAVFDKLPPRRGDLCDDEDALNGESAASARMRLRTVTLTGHAIDDSLLFFHCFGEPTERHHYTPPSPSPGGASSDGSSRSKVTSAVPMGSRKRIWAPLRLSAAQLLPMKQFLESSLDEAMGFGRTGSDLYFEGNDTRRVAPQSVVRRIGEDGKEVRSRQQLHHADDDPDEDAGGRRGALGDGDDIFEEEDYDMDS